MTNEHNMEKNNQVYLVGEVFEEPVFSHNVENENFYELKLEVKRQSLSSDIIPVLISENLLKDDLCKCGEKIALTGEFRSYNKTISPTKNKLVLSVFCKEKPKTSDEEDRNDIFLRGFVCKQPIYRVTPFGRQIADVLLAINRPRYKRSDYIPTIAWGRNAIFAGTLKVGTEVMCQGRIQSRQYLKTLEDGTQKELTAYEVSLRSLQQCENGIIYDEKYSMPEKQVEINK